MNMDSEEELEDDDSLSDESRELLRDAKDWNERLRRQVRKPGQSDSYNKSRGIEVVRAAGTDVEMLRRKLLERESYHRRANGAIDKAEEEGRLTPFDAETARLNLRRRMTRSKTSLALDAKRCRWTRSKIKSQFPSTSSSVRWVRLTPVTATRLTEARKPKRKKQRKTTVTTLPETLPYSPVAAAEGLPARLNVLCTCSSVRGARLRNEDRCIAGTLALPANSEAAVAFVAHGVGGAAGGEVAASTAVQQCLLSATRELWMNTEKEPKPLSVILREVFEEANDAISRRAKENPILKEMATTVVGMLHREGRMAVGGLGDSRAYLYREGILERLTRDHSLPQQLVDEGVLPPGEMENHPLGHVITHFLGLGEDRTSLVVREYDVKPGDLIVLCTDGFWKFGAAALPCLCDSYIRRGMGSHELKQLVSELIQEALARNSDDNVSMVLVYVCTGEDGENLRKTRSYWKEGG